MAKFYNRSFREGVVRERLEQYIEKDWQEGKVVSMLERFAGLTDKQLNGIFDQYGSALFGTEERTYYLEQTHQRQEMCRVYLNQLSETSSFVPSPPV